MASYGKFQNPYHKYAGHANLFKAPKLMIKEKPHPDNWEEKIIDWTTFYRRNIHRFIEHYFQVKLYLYQVIWIYYMSQCELFVTIASRASAKSWLIGLYALAYGVLYPGSEIVVASSTMKQARIVIDKIKMLQDGYPNIAREIKEFKDSQNRVEVVLHSGTVIRVVSATDTSRGFRANLIIAEEFRIMDKTKYDEIIKPFLISRQCPYLSDPKYSNLAEEPREIMISSAYYKSEWWYTTTAEVIKMMVCGKSAGFIAFDYLIALKHGIKTKKLIDKERQTMDTITFEQEYLNIPWGNSENAFFKMKLFSKAQNIKKAFYPKRIENVGKKNNPYSIKKIEGEIRVVSVDVATRGGKNNDATAIICARLLPTSNGYDRDIVYLETHNGENTILQSLRIKQLFYDFESDYLVMDMLNQGITIYDNLGKVTKDDERDIEYPAWTVLNGYGIDEKVYNELFERTSSLNAIPVIFPISATAKMNNDIAFSLKNKIELGMMNFLLDENSAEEYLSKTNKEFIKNLDDYQSKLWFLNPYIQTVELINEMMSLDMKVNNGLIKLQEPTGHRKDRYSSLSYLNYFVDKLDADIVKEKDDGNLIDFIKSANVSIERNSHLFKFR